MPPGLLRGEQAESFSRPRGVSQAEESPVGRDRVFEAFGEGEAIGAIGIRHGLSFGARAHVVGRRAGAQFRGWCIDGARRPRQCFAYAS